MKLSITNCSIAFALSIVLSGCGSDTTEDVGEAQAPSLMEIKEILPGTMFATFDPKNWYDQMQSAAKTACGTEAICKVIIFPPSTILPSQFPMTEREVSQQIGNYTLNRNSGADELLVRCDKVMGAPKETCFSKE